PFSNDLRTGATFVHDWFAFGIWVAVLGHIFFAIRDPIALGGMTRGGVTPYWARTERPAWYRELTGDTTERSATRSAGSPWRPQRPSSPAPSAPARSGPGVGAPRPHRRPPRPRAP